MTACLLLLAASQGAPLAPEESARRLNLPEGFRATVFAAEPDLVQPIAFTLDDRGRVWAVESRSYPNWLPPGTEGRDRILIFEDTKGNGTYDKRTVFLEGLDLYPGAGFKAENHIQVCVRNPNCVKGYFLPREKDGRWRTP